MAPSPGRGLFLKNLHESIARLRGRKRAQIVSRRYGETERQRVGKRRCFWQESQEHQETQERIPPEKLKKKRASVEDAEEKTQCQEAVERERRQKQAGTQEGQENRRPRRRTTDPRGPFLPFLPSCLLLAALPLSESIPVPRGSRAQEENKRRGVTLRLCGLVAARAAPCLWGDFSSSCAIHFVVILSGTVPFFWNPG